MSPGSREPRVPKRVREKQALESWQLMSFAAVMKSLPQRAAPLPTPGAHAML